MSVTSHWLIAVTHGFDVPDSENFRLSAYEVEGRSS